MEYNIILIITKNHKACEKLRWKSDKNHRFLFRMLSNVLILERAIIFPETIVKILEIKLDLIVGEELTFVAWEMSRRYRDVPIALQDPQVRAVSRSRNL